MKSILVVSSFIISAQVFAGTPAVAQPSTSLKQAQYGY